MMFGFPTLAWKLIGYAVIALAIFGAGMKLMSAIDAGALAKCKATIAAQTAVVKQVTAVTTQITKSDQAQEAAAQTALARQATVITKEITHYVPVPAPGVSVPCVSNGMLRVHDAAVLGVDPSEVLPPASQPDDSCSPVTATDFMAAVAGNYATARENAEQLNALEADVKSREAAVAAAGP